MESEKQHHDHAHMNHDQANAASNATAGQMDHAMHDTHQMQGSEHAGHVNHTGHEEMFRRRFWVSLVLSIPVLLYTPMLQTWFGFRLPELPGSQWVAPLFA